MTDQELCDRLDDVSALGLTLWAEARGESLDGRVAVAWVVRHRVADPRWPDSPKAVVFQPRQFSCWNVGRDANAQAVRLAGERLVLGERPDPVLAECLWLAHGVLDGALRDTSRGANHYLTEHAYRLFTPRWVRGMVVTTTLGNHVFLKG